MIFGARRNINLVLYHFTPFKRPNRNAKTSAKLDGSIPSVLFFPILPHALNEILTGGKKNLLKSRTNRIGVQGMP